MNKRISLFREREAHNHSPVTYIELFFDLVFVFAITQLSHHLQAHLSVQGSLETFILFLAVWWLWIYTSWTTNWLDPEHDHVRLMLIILMLGGLALSASLPAAFGGSGIVFAGTYVALQVGRTAYAVWAARGVFEARKRNFIRIAFYFLLATPLWLLGAWLHNEARIAAWLAALAIEYAGPFLMFRTPFVGKSTIADWDISGGHMAERCALFIIIALGEAVLVTGASYADLTHDWPTSIAFAMCFVGSATMWWIYFDVGAKRGSSLISTSHNAGRIARNAYTYLHMPIVAGIVVTAVGDSLMLTTPDASITPAFLLTVLGGPFLFVLGNQGFKWITSSAKYPPLSHLIGEFLLLATAMLAWYQQLNLLITGILGTLCLVVVALWEWFSLHGGWQRWIPWIVRLGRWLPLPPDGK